MNRYSYIVIRVIGDPLFPICDLVDGMTFASVSIVSTDSFVTWDIMLWPKMKICCSMKLMRSISRSRIANCLHLKT